MRAAQGWTTRSRSGKLLCLTLWWTPAQMKFHIDNIWGCWQLRCRWKFVTAKSERRWNIWVRILTNIWRCDERIRRIQSSWYILPKKSPVFLLWPQICLLPKDRLSKLECFPFAAFFGLSFFDDVLRRIAGLFLCSYSLFIVVNFIDT